MAHILVFCWRYLFLELGKLIMRGGDFEKARGRTAKKGPRNPDACRFFYLIGPFSTHPIVPLP